MNKVTFKPVPVLWFQRVYKSLLFYSAIVLKKKVVEVTGCNLNIVFVVGFANGTI